MGGCLCGAVRYEVQGKPFNRTICHCSICRRAAGAPMVAWFSVAVNDFRFVAGNPKQFRSSPKGTRTFCPDCGTQLTFGFDDQANELDVTIASLDDPSLVPPSDHTFFRDRVSWLVLADDLPTYDEARPSR
ncbi:MAG TPA: GFA family protein [Polyangiaceae bacterium]